VYYSIALCRLGFDVACEHTGGCSRHSRILMQCRVSSKQSDVRQTGSTFPRSRQPAQCGTACLGIARLVSPLLRSGIAAE
jgi:hypothetical protein